MEFNFQEVDAKWQKYWKEHKTFQVEEDESKPKYYVLDMFPYPSGAGLHVGHPLGYIASDIYSVYKRLKGFNVLHPMGYDAFGLPAEQYAIQTGRHPAETTEENIKRYRAQLDKIGFSFDWSRQVKTCDPDYYKWTQWAFVQMFEHWYDNEANKAKPITELINTFEKEGNKNINAASSQEEIFSAQEWEQKNEKEKSEILLNYRLAYLADTMVNWCPKLGSVLANDEVINGVSERGGYPVEQKKMQQWSLRISAYAERLLSSLDNLDWSNSLKEMQRNWIGKSQGAEMIFKVKNSGTELEIFTTRPDTVFGVSFMVLAPESEYVQSVITDKQKEEADKYIKDASLRSERDRQADTKSVSGVFTGSYAINPFTKEEIPIYISDYVLAGYGTGAIMAVPAHDSRDYAFAKHFNLPIPQVIKPADGEIPEEGSYDTKEGTIINSGFITNMEVKEAINAIIEKVEELGIGKRKINYRLRDAVFSRQRYWGEPFPVYFKDGMPQVLKTEELPLELPEVDKYLPTEDGRPPLGRAVKWETPEGHPFELSTMPGFAGSSAYYLRYMDPNNNKALVSEKANNYWRDVDLYVGGTEHATGHLIYSRFWNKFLFDCGFVCEDEPFKKMLNQGMIQGRSSIVYRVRNENKFVSKGLKKNYQTDPIHVDINLAENDLLDIEGFKAWRPEFKDADFILEDGKYHCGFEIEKMSKRYYNVVNPDDIVEQYGADTLRMYEMFLGPVQDSKPWNTNGISGVHSFLKKLWRTFYNIDGKFEIVDEKADDKELKVLHKTIKKIGEDIENFSFNTAVSAFMICLNDLTALKCKKKEIFEPFLITLAPFAPHISEELWAALGNKNSIRNAKFPEYDEKYLKEDAHSYPVSFNGKMRFKLDLPTGISKEDAEKSVLENEKSQKWLDGKTPKKVIFVPGKIINIVV